MQFTAHLEKRLTLAVQSSLFCAALLVPMAALTETTDKTRDGEITVATAQAATTVTATTVTHPTDVATQQKINRLSGHIQRNYPISEAKARYIVEEVLRNARQHRLEPELLLALIAVESTFRERAVSRVGARGLMQVMPLPHADKVQAVGGAHQLFNPTHNIRIGSQILANYLDKHSGNLKRALLNYNGSLGTRSSFPDRVLRTYRDFQRVTVEG